MSNPMARMDDPGHLPCFTHFGSALHRHRHRYRHRQAGAGGGGTVFCGGRSGAKPCNQNPVVVRPEPARCRQATNSSHGGTAIKPVRRHGSEDCACRGPRCDPGRGTISGPISSGFRRATDNRGAPNPLDESVSGPGWRKEGSLRGIRQRMTSHRPCGEAGQGLELPGLNAPCRAGSGLSPEPEKGISGCHSAPEKCMVRARK